MFPIPLPRALAGAVLLIGATVTQAATFSVTVPQDVYDGICDKHCSLRDAVAAANRKSGGDRIVLPEGSYDLSLKNPLDGNRQPIDEDNNALGDLDVTDRLVISGDGMFRTTLYGLINDRLIEVRPDAQLTLEHMTLGNGRSVLNGGAVENHGTLEVRDVLVINNRVFAWEPSNEPGDRFHDGRGGGIASYGKLTVIASRFQDNAALGDEIYGGLGGAIYSKGTLWVQDSFFHYNFAGTPYDTGAGAAIFNSGQARIERSAVIDHVAQEYPDGGAITNDGGTLELLNSTLSGNEGSLTNGFYDEATGQSKAILTNVTITRSPCYVFGNCHEAVINGGDLSIRNSIIAGNGEGGSEDNCMNVGRYYRYRSKGLLTNDDGGNCTGDYYVRFVETFEKVLSEQLAVDNGSTDFHRLLPGSPAVDAGIAKCTAHDQRGVRRPQDGNGDGLAVCDLGAYELAE